MSRSAQPEGQALQAKFIESYAEELRDRIEDRLVLIPGQSVSRLTFPMLALFVGGPQSVVTLTQLSRRSTLRAFATSSAPKRPVASGSGDQEGASMRSPRERREQAPRLPMM
jgi:hypothetical protein